MESGLPNIVSILAASFPGTPFAKFLLAYENIIFSWISAFVIIILVLLASHKISLIPRGLQNFFELFVETIDEFVCGVIGPKGRRFTPFIGTLFIYILFMNLSGLIPFFKSATSSWSITLALALCVFIYVQYCALKEMGLFGYLDHLAGNPRGFIAYTLFVPLLMFFVHVISELVKPLSLSLRLRSNVWGDDFLLYFLTGMGLQGIPLLLFSSLLTVIAGIVQAMVFSLLTTVYFALVVENQEPQKN